MSQIELAMEKIERGKRVRLAVILKLRRPKQSICSLDFSKQPNNIAVSFLLCRISQFGASSSQAMPTAPAAKLSHSNHYVAGLW